MSVRRAPLTDAARHVSVVIPHAGDTARLERCLESLGADRVHEILVVLPEAASGSVQLVERHPRARPVPVPRLLSFAQATNLGASMATGELLFLLNDDTVVQEGAVERLADAFAAQQDLGCGGAMLLNLDGTPQPSVYGYPSWRAVGELVFHPLFRRGPLAGRARFPYTRPPAVGENEVWLSGAALMVRRKLFFEVGALDEEYPHGIEDAVFCRAVQDRGYRLALIEDARVVHEGGVSSYRSAGSQHVAKALVGGTRGWIRYWRENGAGPASIVMLRATLLFFGLSRLVVYSAGSVVPGPWHERYRFKRDAYADYMRRMLSRRADGPSGRA